MCTRVALLSCSETYQYYTLPFCEPVNKKYKTEGLGGVLAGDRTVNSLYSVKFAKDSSNSTLCNRKLSAKDVEKFRDAVKSEYYFQVSMCRPKCRHLGVLTGCQGQAQFLEMLCSGLSVPA
jgi:hypothetical protein